jgi:hypothetical protein
MIYVGAIGLGYYAVGMVEAVCGARANLWPVIVLCTVYRLFPGGPSLGGRNQRPDPKGVGQLGLC